MENRMSALEATMDSRISKLETTMDAFMRAFDQKFSQLDTKYDQFPRDVSARRDSTFPDDSGDGNHEPHPNSVFPSQRPPLMKMEFPRFCDGDDPLGWIYRAEHYFDYFSVPDAQKVKLASFHMEREALQWFQWLDCIHRFPRWEEFTKALCQEFGSSDLEDCAESLLKLKQTGSLRDYISEFRRLANRTRDMTPSILRSCFIGGLKKELRHDVKLLRPTSVQDACALASQLNASLL
ncbi:unnamed protein product, partial [Prunus brigantina]